MPGPIGSDYEVLDPRFERLINPMARVERLATGGRWTEGPVYFPVGRFLLWSDVAGDCILRYDETDGHVGVFRRPSSIANGNTIDRQGWLITCEHETRRISRTEHDGRITTVADAWRGRRLNSPNDVVVKSDGTIWFRLVRDDLMIALLSLCPIRLGNLHSLRLGRQIRKIGDQWWIILPADETKSGRPDERPIHHILTPYIDRWAEYWRTLYPNGEDHFWPSIAGGRLAYTYVGAIITETTRRELGVPVNPHLFRDCSIYTIADRAGDEMGVASGLLQHLDPRVTESPYNKGATFGAARKYQAILARLGAE